MQGISTSKAFTTTLVAFMAALALMASLFAVQPAFADDLAAGSLSTQNLNPSIKVKDTNKVTVAKSITIKAENLTKDQTGTWMWTVKKGSSLVSVSGTDTDTIKVKGVKGGTATLQVAYITDNGKKSTKTLKVNVYGIKSTITKSGIVYQRTSVNTVKVLKTKDRKDLGKKTITIPKTIKVGNNSKYKATYKVTSINRSALVSQKSTTKIVVGDNVKTIGTHAFCGAKKLKSLVIGKSVTKLGKYMVHSNVKSLKTVTIKSTKLTKANVKKCFTGNKTIKTVKVPKSKVKAYKKIFTKANCGAKVTVKAI